MRKLIALLLVLLLTAGLAACGVVPVPLLPANPSQNETEAPVSENGAPKTEPAPDTEPTPDTESAPAAPAFEARTVIDNELCTMKISSIQEDSFWGYTLKTELENKTENKDLSFAVKEASINGVGCSAMFLASVAAGKKANEDISLSDDALKDLIGPYTDIDLTVLIYDSDNWGDSTEERFHIYPLGEDAAANYVREPQPTDTVLADSNEFSVIVTGYDPDALWGYAVNFYLVNKADHALTVTADDVSVNGVMCEPYWLETLQPGKALFSSMDWTDSLFEDNNITEVEEIEFKLVVRNSEDYLADPLAEKPVTLKP